MNNISLALKIDVDTDRGTRVGVPNMLQLFKKLNIPATFLFSLGPDNTGRALKRIFRPGFLSKVRRTKVVSVYGWRTLLNGVLFPGPHIGKRNAVVMRHARELHHEVGIHCYDHIRWQDGLHKMNQDQVTTEFAKARKVFENIFGMVAQTAGAAGWQANAMSLTAYDEAKLFYGSDCRGEYPFIPRVNGKVFKTLQIPSTLPTLDELLGREEFQESNLTSYYLSLLQADRPNIFTIHAELEGMAKLDWFTEFLQTAKERGVNFVKMEDIARTTLQHYPDIPVCELVQGAVAGRSGTMAVQQL
ncbi:polysaccharide deacetylase family protein [soil metagenome]